jgi:uncharacterized pyridoxal phosphate-containing UPF0001 family protein
VDRTSLVGALGSEDAGDLGVFLEIGLSREPGRGGIPPAEAESLAERVLATPGLRLLGVMGVAPLDDEPRPAFARLRAVSDGIRLLAPHATAISAGMSGDFQEAILEGATHLRIGTAITGKRPTPG